ncbi:nucleoside-diphosphate kinase [Alkaliphilus serpentinus]|nr:nucleoside-diphosphate kinase [Alkaliphilus serpentinus]
MSIDVFEQGLSIENERDKVSRALFLIRTEAIQRNLVGEIIKRIEKKGLKIIGIKMVNLNEEIMCNLYSNCFDLPYFDEMLRYHTEGPVIVLVVEGINGNKNANEVCGKVGISGTIRGDLSMHPARNLLHCSNLDKSNYEIEVFFKENELFEYDLFLQRWTR